MFTLPSTDELVFTVHDCIEKRGRYHNYRREEKEAEGPLIPSPDEKEESTLVDDECGLEVVDLDVPRNGLARLETSDTPALDVEHHQVRASGDSGSIRRVGIPPLLSVGIDPAVVGVFAAGVVNVRATEIEPPDGL